MNKNAHRNWLVFSFENNKYNEHIGNVTLNDSAHLYYLIFNASAYATKETKDNRTVL